MWHTFTHPCPHRYTYQYVCTFWKTNLPKKGNYVCNTTRGIRRQNHFKSIVVEWNSLHPWSKGGNIKLLSWHSWFFHYYCTVLSHFEMGSKWWLQIIISTSTRRKIANEILLPFWLTVCSLWLTEPQWVVIHGFVVVETAIELSRFKLSHWARWTEFINFSHL